MPSESSGHRGDEAGRDGAVDAERLKKTVLSIGVDRESADKLLSNRELDRIIVPIYWKDGIVNRTNNSFWLIMLPRFLEEFAEEFPDGQVRWDPAFEDEDVEGRPSLGVAIRVFFNYQEGDQGDRWAPKPDELEEASYQRMLSRCAYRGEHKPVQARSVVRG